MSESNRKGLSRRQFIQMSAASAASLAGGALAAGCGGGGARIGGGEFDVVVGAGTAGLGAAQRLKSLGVRTIVLEARNRIGGRCYCDNTLPAPFDFGGQFFHQVSPNPLGGTNNPLYDIYRSQGGLDLPVVLQPTFYGAGAQLPPAQQQPFIDMVQQCGAIVFPLGAAASVGGPDASFKDATSSLAGQPWYTLASAFAEAGLDAPPERLSCEEMFNLVYYGTNVDGSTSDRVNPTGMGNFIAQFAKGLQISLNTAVTKIDTSGTLIRVETGKGAFTCRAVIVTAPVSLLAAGKIAFTPGLPVAYTQAFHDLPFGLIDKVGISFTSNVWGDIPANSSVMRYGDVNSVPFGFANYAGKPQMNMLISDPVAHVLEAGGVPAFQDFARQFVSDTIGSAAANAIDRMVTHLWGQDEFTMGSYSAALPGKVGARTTLATPIDGRIFFAGEAVAVAAHSSLHGAFITGKAAATGAAKSLGFNVPLDVHEPVKR